MVTLDYGSGSPQEAAAELAYLQGSPSDTTSIGTGLEWNDSTEPVAERQLGHGRLLGQPAGRIAAGHRRRPEFPADRSSGPLHRHQVLGSRQRGIRELGSRSPRHGRSRRSEHRRPARPGHLRGLRRAVCHAGRPRSPARPACRPSRSASTAAIRPAPSDNDWTKNVLTDGLSIGFVPGFISDHSYMQAPGERERLVPAERHRFRSPAASWIGRRATPTTSPCSSRRCREPGLERAGHGHRIQLRLRQPGQTVHQPGQRTVHRQLDRQPARQRLPGGWSGTCATAGRPATTTATCSTAGAKGATTANWAIPTRPRALHRRLYRLSGLLRLATGLEDRCRRRPGRLGDQQLWRPRRLRGPTESDGHLDLLVINTNPAASLTDQFNVTGFQPGGSAQVWQYGETQDTAQSQTTNGASALANSTATLNVSGIEFQLHVSGLFDDRSRLDAGPRRSPPRVRTPTTPPAVRPCCRPWRNGIFQRHRPQRCHGDDLGRHAAVGRYAELHQPRR